MTDDIDEALRIIDDSYRMEMDRLTAKEASAREVPSRLLTAEGTHTGQQPQTQAPIVRPDGYEDLSR